MDFYHVNVTYIGTIYNYYYQQNNEYYYYILTSSISYIYPNYLMKKRNKKRIEHPTSVSL